MIPLLVTERTFSEPVEEAAKFSWAKVRVILGLSTLIEELPRTIGALSEESLLGADTSNVDVGVTPTICAADFRLSLTSPPPKSVETK